MRIFIVFLLVCCFVFATFSYKKPILDTSFNYPRPVYFNTRLRYLGFDKIPTSESISSDSALVNCFHSSFRMYVNGVTKKIVSPFWKEYYGYSYLRYSGLIEFLPKGW